MKPIEHSLRRRVTFETGDQSMVMQSAKAETEIGNIVKKYRDGLVVDHVNRHQGRYGDFIDAPDFHDAMNKVLEAQDMFAGLPASLRKRFSNDPAEFLSFVNDPENKDELYELGLAVRPVPEKPAAPEDVPESPEKPADAS
jgi:phage internal scaffolding protein